MQITAAWTQPTSEYARARKFSRCVCSFGAPRVGSILRASVTRQSVSSIANQRNYKFVTYNHRQILCTAVQSSYVFLNTHLKPKFLNSVSNSLPLSSWPLPRNHHQMGSPSTSCLSSTQLQIYLHLQLSFPPSISFERVFNHLLKAAQDTNFSYLL